MASRPKQAAKRPDSEKRQGSVPGMRHAMRAWIALPQEWRRRRGRLAQLRAMRIGHAAPLWPAPPHLGEHHAKETRSWQCQPLNRVPCRRSVPASGATWCNSRSRRWRSASYSASCWRWRCSSSRATRTATSLPQRRRTQPKFARQIPWASTRKRTVERGGPVGDKGGAAAATTADVTLKPSLPRSTVPGRDGDAASGKTQPQSLDAQAAVVALPGFVSLDRPRIGDGAGGDDLANREWSEAR